MITKKELEEKRDQLRLFSQHGEPGTWDGDPKEILEEARKLVFAWLIVDAEEGLSKA